MFGYRGLMIRDQCYGFGSGDKGEYRVVRGVVEVEEVDAIECLNSVPKRPVRPSLA